MAKRKRTIEQTMIYKTLHTKLKIEQHKKRDPHTPGYHCLKLTDNWIKKNCLHFNSIELVQRKRFASTFLIGSYI